GGSTEFILGQTDHLRFRASFDIGTVRLMEAVPHSDPPQTSELADCRDRVLTFLTEHVRPKLDPALKELSDTCGGRSMTLVGAGGRATILARLEAKLAGYDRARIESTRLARGRVQELVEQLWSMALADRRRMEGMPADRADVILSGVVIYEAVLNKFDFP